MSDSATAGGAPALTQDLAPSGESPPTLRTDGGDLRVAMRMLGREWRGGELAVLLLALIISVCGITSVSFFVDRVERAMTGRASELLAADLLINARDPIPEEFASKAHESGLNTARTLTFRSVVLAGEAMALTQVKAVSPTYPLRGRLGLTDTPYATPSPYVGAPDRGTVWVEPRLLAQLDLNPDDILEVGASKLRIARILAYEPDRGGALFSIAPRVMMHLDDVPATELVQTGSRVRHRLLMAGPRDAVSSYRRDVTELLPPNSRLEGVSDARPELRTALERAQQFLGLAALVGVLLAGAAIAVSARRHAERHFDTAALLRCLGCSQRTIVRMYGLQLGVLALAGGLIGSALGYLAQLGLTEILGSFVVSDLPAPSLWPLLTGIGVSIVTLAGFGLPPMLSLHRISPARVLRRDLGPTQAPAWMMYAAGLMALGAIAWWQAGYLKLAAMVLAGTAGAVLLLAVGAMALLQLLSLLRPRSGPVLRFAIAGIMRRPRASMLQVVAFGLGLMALLLLALVRAEMLTEWKRSLPADAPNFFLVNIQPDEVAGLEADLRKANIATRDLHPMVRGRVTAINGVAVDPEAYDDPRARRLASREANLSFAAERPPYNPLTAGRWWREGESGWSMEQGLARTLGIEVGDELTFHVAGNKVTAPVLSLRDVKWDSFRVNFFYVASPALLRDQPATYITSFFLDPNRHSLLNQLVRDYPSVTVIDVDALMTQVRGIMDQASLGIEYVFAFTVLSGLMVLFATIQSTLDERRHETAVLRTLGAERRLLVTALLFEFVLLGAVAGLLASAAAYATAAVVANQIFGFTLDGAPWVWVTGISAGAVIIATAGYLSTRKVLEQPPMQSLQAI